ncbi:MAG: DUF4349 domain-containing protein [Chloroflexota bacterium]
MRTILVGLALLLSVGVLVGCSGAAPSPVPSAPQSNAGKSAEVPAAQPADAGQSGGASTAWDRYVIRNAEATLIVKDVETAVGEVEDLANASGGHVSQSNTRRQGDSLVADLVIQVPVDSFDATLDALKGLAVDVESVNTTSEDVTEEFVDNESRLRNLRATEQSTLRLLDQATRMEDILAVQRELTNIRGEIEKIEGRQQFLQRRVEMSTITVHLRLESATVLAAGRTGWQPLRTAAVAWEASLSFLKVASDAILTLVVFFWWAFPVAAATVVLIRRRGRGKQRKVPVPIPDGSR